MKTDVRREYRAARILLKKGLDGFEEVQAILGRETATALVVLTICRNNLEVEDIPVSDRERDMRAQFRRYGMIIK